MAKKLFPLAWISVLALVPAAGSEAVSRFATLDGSKIHYLSFGQGDTAVVFIHGWTCDSTFWKAQAPIYENRRSLLIDLPGHGQSDKPDIKYTMELFARAVDAVMKDAKVDKATLVGHSMGTPVAVQYLRLHPDRVAGIVIVDGFIPRPPKDKDEAEKGRGQSVGLARAYRGPEYRNFAKRMIGAMFTPQTDPALKEEIETKMLATPQHVMASAMEGMASMAPLTESYPDLPVVAVMEKRPTSAKNEEFLRQHFRLVGYRDLEDTGHFVMLEKPDTFNKILKEFLDRK